MVDGQGAGKPLALNYVAPNVPVHVGTGDVHQRACRARSSPAGIPVARRDLCAHTCPAPPRRTSGPRRSPTCRHWPTCRWSSGAQPRDGLGSPARPGTRCVVRWWRTPPDHGGPSPVTGRGVLRTVLVVLLVLLVQSTVGDRRQDRRRPPRPDAPPAHRRRDRRRPRRGGGDGIRRRDGRRPAPSHPLRPLRPGRLPGRVRGRLRHRVDHPGDLVVTGRWSRSRRALSRSCCTPCSAPSSDRTSSSTSIWWRSWRSWRYVNAVLAGPAVRLVGWASVPFRPTALGPRPPEVGGERATPCAIQSGGDRRYAKPVSARQHSRGQGAGAPALEARARQPRMRPRRSVNVAALVASPEDTPSRPLLRLQIVGADRAGALRGDGPAAVEPADHRRQDVRGRGHRQPDPTVAVARPAGLIVDRNDTVLAGNRTETRSCSPGPRRRSTRR